MAVAWPASTSACPPTHRPAESVPATLLDRVVLWISALPALTRTPLLWPWMLLLRMRADVFAQTSTPLDVAPPPLIVTPLMHTSAEVFRSSTPLPEPGSVIVTPRTFVCAAAV